MKRDNGDVLSTSRSSESGVFKTGCSGERADA
jgi:hypothetical protein